MEKFTLNVSRVWNQIGKDSNRAVIFMDNPCAECLHWSGGPEILYCEGALDIKEFSPFESGGSNHKRAVFVVSTALTGPTSKTIEDIVKSSSFTECVIITTVSEDIHQIMIQIGTPEESRIVFGRIEQKIHRWLSSTNSIVEVKHIPLFIAPIASNLFVTPSFDSLFPIQKKDLRNLNLQVGERPPENLCDLHLYMLPPEYQSMIRTLASLFYNFFDLMDCKSEVFAFGHTSHLFAVQLSNMTNKHKKANKDQIGFLFIDRALDLTGPCSHIEKSLVDQLIGILPALPEHHNNISVDMRKLCASFSNEDDEENIFPGCLLAADDLHSGENILSEIFNMDAKDAVKRIKQLLQQAISDEGLKYDPSDLEGLDTGEEMESLVLKLKENPGAILYNSALLQLCLGVSQAFTDEQYETWKTIAMTEKLMLQHAEDKNAIIPYITKLVDDGDCSITIENILSLLVYAIHGLGASMNSDDLSDLSRAISLLLFNTPHDELPESIIDAFKIEENDTEDIDKCQKVVDGILEKAANLEKQHLHHFSTLKFGDVEPPRYEPLLSQVISRIFHPDKPELKPDIEYVSTGRKDLLNMGISMFRKISPPRPSDYGTMVVYVVGGITATELQQMNKVAQRYESQGFHLVVGSNKLISPEEIAERTLFSDNLHPGCDGSNLY